MTLDNKQDPQQSMTIHDPSRIGTSNILDTLKMYFWAFLPVLGGVGY